MTPAPRTPVPPLGFPTPVLAWQSHFWRLRYEALQEPKRSAAGARDVVPGVGAVARSHFQLSERRSG
jgi:hypothetical protein